MSEILSFIKVFHSPSNEILFKDCACYWFSHILHTRFPDSCIMYNPHQVHFATKINGTIYDIEGIIEDDSEYIDWEEYSTYADDIDMIISNCINLERR